MDPKLISEISKETLKSYVSKAKADPSFEVKRGKVPAAKKAQQDKRRAGLERAAKKLDAIRQADTKARLDKMDAHTKSLHKQFHAEAPAILAKHGYKKAADSEHRVTYVRPHESGHVNTVTLNKKWSQYGDGATHHLGSSTGWSGVHHRAHDTLYDDESYHKAKKEMMPKFEAAVIANHNHYHMNESVEDFSEDFLNESEELDEISKKTLRSYITKSLDSVEGNANKVGTHLEKSHHASPSYRDFHKNIARASQKKASKRMYGIETAITKLTKESEELEEGRGQRGMAKRKDSDYDNEWGSNDNDRYSKKNLKQRLHLARNRKYNSRDDD